MTSDGLSPSPGITNQQLREMLKTEFRTASDFDAFVMDNFPEVAKRYSNGQDLLSKTNLLLDLIPAAEIYKKIQDGKSHRCGHFLHPQKMAQTPGIISWLNANIELVGSAGLLLTIIAMLIIFSGHRIAPKTFPSSIPVNLNKIDQPEMVISEKLAHIPAGKTIIGADDGDENERPAHYDNVDDYLISTLEITAEFYGECVKTGTCEPTDSVFWEGMGSIEKNKWSAFCTFGKPGKEKHPMNCVNWYQASTYCAWRRMRLPTEKEWEYSVRGKNGRLYPWGSDPPGPALLNACGNECVDQLFKMAPEAWSRMYDGNDGWPLTAPVGSISGDQSPEGVFDLGGNVAEWVADSYRDCYRKDCQSDDALRTVKGATWATGEISIVRGASRSGRPPTRKTPLIGFRCAKTNK